MTQRRTPEDEAYDELLLEVGLDEDTVEAVGLKPAEFSTLSGLLMAGVVRGDPGPLRSGVRKIVFALHGATEAAEKATRCAETCAKRERGRRNSAIRIVCIVAAIAGFLSFDSWRITVDPTDGTVISIHERWWGFERDEAVIEWTTPPGYDYPAWVAYDENEHPYTRILLDRR